MSVSELVTTPGAANANAFVTLAVADQYHEDRPAVGTTWANSGVANKKAAILYATKLMCALWVWDGYRTSREQALDWPRVGVLAENQLENIPDDEVPILIQYATAEFARQLMAANRTEDYAIEAKGITSFSAGPISIAFKEAIITKVVPDAVWNLIPGWWGYVRNRSRDFCRLVRA